MASKTKAAVSKPEIPKHIYKALRAKTEHYIKGFNVRVDYCKLPLIINFSWTSDKSFDVSIRLRSCYPLTAREKLLVGVNVLKKEEVLASRDTDLPLMIPVVRKYQKELKDFCRQLDRYEKKYDFYFDSLLIEIESKQSKGG